MLLTMPASTLGELRACLQEDLRANGVARVSLRALAKRPTVRFVVVLRTAEWLGDKSSVAARVAAALVRAYLLRISVRLGFNIPTGVCAPGLALPHWGSIVVSGYSRIGRNVRIHSGVNIGGTAHAAPVIGDNCYLGPGAKLFGAIELGDGCIVGANAVVTRSFEPNQVVAGNPARVIRNVKPGERNATE